jgi:molecular chaperone GrpE
MAEREDITPGADEAPDSGFEEEREEYVREHPDEAESGGSGGSGESGGGEESPPADSEASALEQDIGELREKARERDEYLSLAQRTQADFENYRKRVSKDIAVAEAKGVAKLARELLPALDNLAIALQSGDSGEEFVRGIELVNAELNAALERLGVEAYSPEGERFDPNLHEAMAKQPVDGAESGTVVEVYQRGYRQNGTVLRPARVVVAE